MKDIDQEIIMIAAIQNDRGIGYKGKLIHRIGPDMDHFVEQTKGHSVIMGRQCISEKYLPLKDKENIIVTRNENYQLEGVITASSLEEAIYKSTGEKVYIIGGGQIYKLGLIYADTLDLTLIDADKPADIYFPEHEGLFELTESSEIMTDTKTDLDYRFTTWKRK